jgi:mannose-P-dolichol utilization defect protein 1
MQFPIIGCAGLANKMRSVLALCFISSVYAADFFECTQSLLAGTITSECLAIGVSKVLSTAIIAGAFGVKFPQILKIVRAKRVDGISESAFYLEVLSLTLASAYSFHSRQPFSTYGENVVILVQCCIQVVLLWKFTGASLLKVLGVSLLFSGICAALFLDLIPAYLWDWTVLSLLALNISFRVSQIAETFKSKTTGQLSVVTATLNFLGVVARSFTILVEVDDVMLLTNVLSVLVLNGVILLQFVIYWSGKPKTN